MKTPHGFTKALKLFKQTADSTPAYQAFLRKNKIKPGLINSPAQFATVPPVDKKHYLKAYPYVDLFPHRRIPSVVSASSGSSGTPFYWPRGEGEAAQGLRSHQNILENVFDIADSRVLFIDCFSMGSWIAGTYTFECVKAVAARGNAISIVTPGIERGDALQALREYAPLFELVIVAGYPPLVMDLLADAKEKGIDLPRLNIRLLMAGESYSEPWRDYIHELIAAQDTLHTSIDVYGTADAGLVGHETPLSIFLRRESLTNKMLSQELFGAIGPRASLVQYYSEYTYFEEHKGELLFTAPAGIPLVRYSIGDSGKLFSSFEIRALLKKYGLEKKVTQLGLERWLPMNMLALYGRKDVAVTYYALNIYPEHIKSGLEDKKLIESCTGKFQASVQLLKRGKVQKLHLHVELKRNVRAGRALKKRIEKVIFEHLLKSNSEYTKLYATVGGVALPVVTLFPYGDAQFQVRRAKVAWVRR